MTGGVFIRLFFFFCIDLLGNIMLQFFSGILGFSFWEIMA